MNREYHRWFSPSLNHDMELLIFGHAGQPVLVFPTSMGSFFEFEDRGMVQAVAGDIEGGRIRLICVDSIDSQSWYNRGIHPHDRVARYLDYERYILDEVLPLIRSTNRGFEDQRVVVSGCSLGAFHAAELAFRHPWVVDGLLALSGKYDNSSFLDGYSDTETYFTNPLAFLQNLGDPSILDAIRAMNIVIVSGSDDPHIQEARRLAQLLREKDVPNTLDIWQGWVHDWPYWQQMIRKYL